MCTIISPGRDTFMIDYNNRLSSAIANKSSEKMEERIVQFIKSLDWREQAEEVASNTIEAIESFSFTDTEPHIFPVMLKNSFCHEIFMKISNFSEISKGKYIFRCLFSNDPEKFFNHCIFHNGKPQLERYQQTGRACFLRFIFVQFMDVEMDQCYDRTLDVRIKDAEGRERIEQFVFSFDVQIIKRNRYYEMASADIQQQMANLIREKMQAYKEQRKAAFDTSPFAAALHTLLSTTFSSVKSRYLLRGPLEHRGNGDLGLRYSAMDMVRYFHAHTFNTFYSMYPSCANGNLRLYLSKTQFTQFSAMRGTLFDMGLQLFEDRCPDGKKEDYDEEGFFNADLGKAVRREKRLLAADRKRKRD